MPAENGSVTPRAAAAATAASAALPPERRISSPARDASKSTVDTAPPRPMATGVLTAVGAPGSAGGRAAGAAAPACAGAAVTASAAATTPVVATMVQRWRYDVIEVPLSPGTASSRNVDQYSTPAVIRGDAGRNGRGARSVPGGR